MAQQILSTNTFTTAKFIVSATASDGTHTTIAAALTAASSGDTIFIRPGTYTENLTLKAGVNLTAYECDSAPLGSSTVNITGKATFTAAGTVNITGIQLNTNSDFVVAVTGSANSVLCLQDCYINATNNTAISFTTSGASSAIIIESSRGDLGTTGIALFSHSAAGTLTMRLVTISNSGASTTANTCSAGAVSLTSTFLSNAVTCSGTGSINAKYSEIDVSGNATALTTVAGSTNTLHYVRLASGSSTPISVGGTVTATYLVLHHTNATGITGAGTLIYDYIAQTSTIGTISATTLTPKGTVGAIASTAPAAGYIGELVSSAVTTPTTLTVNTITNVASITPSAGIWEVSGIVKYDVATGVGVTSVQGCLATTNNGFVPIDSFGDGVSCGIGNLPFTSAAMSPQVHLGPSRLSTTGSTVVYLNAFLAATSAATRTYEGVIRAVRVA